MSYPNNDCCTETLIHQLVKVQAQVTVTPLVKHGEPRVYVPLKNALSFY